MKPVTVTANAMTPARRDHLVTLEKKPNLAELRREGKGLAHRYLTGDVG